MARTDSRWPKKETPKAKKQNNSKWPCSSFNIKTWKNLGKVGFFGKNYYPKKNHISTYEC